MDEKVIKELEELYADVEGWSDEERQSHIRFAYNSIMAQREAQAKYGAVDANDPVAVQAAMEQRMAENGGTVNKIKGASVSGAAAGNTGAAGSNVTSGAAVVQNTVDKEYEAAAKNVESSVDAATKAAVAEVEAAKAKPRPSISPSGTRWPCRRPMTRITPPSMPSCGATAAASAGRSMTASGIPPQRITRKSTAPRPPWPAQPPRR